MDMFNDIVRINLCTQYFDIISFLASFIIHSRSENMDFKVNIQTIDKLKSKRLVRKLNT